MKTSKENTEGTSTRVSRTTAAAPVGPIRQLQGVLGIQGVQQLLRTRLLQPKLTVSQPDDVCEQEAERVADEVLRMPEPAAGIDRTAAPHVQRQCADCEDELKRRPLEEMEEMVQTRPALTGALVQRQARKEEELLQAHSEPAASTTVTAGVEDAIHSLSGRGQPLSESVRSFMEPRFNTDFSAVRLHTDNHAHELARAVNAQAFTVGRDIVFGAGHYAPESERGRHLLAHELTHTLQQGSNVLPRVRAHQPSPAPRIPLPALPVAMLTRIQRRVFGTFVQLDSLPGPPPRARLHGPYSDEAIAEELYGDRGSPVEHDPRDSTIVFVRYADLRDEWKPYFEGAVGEEDALFSEYSAEEIAEAGTFALGTLLHQSSGVAETFRNIYNEGVTAIVAERARLITEALPGEAGRRIVADLGSNLDRSEMISRLTDALPEAQATRIAERVATMRHELALQVRRASGQVLQKGAELIDAVRGQARPTYAALRAAGRSDAEIIRSATRTNRFVNRLPSGMRIAGGALWLVTAGISVYIVFSAEPADRARVAREEVGSLIGAAGGTLAVEGLCIVTGIATGGLGLVVCGILGGLIGGAIGRNPQGFLQFLDIAPHVSPARAGAMYRLEGTLEEVDLLIISIPTRTVPASEHAVVVGTGTVSGQLVGGRGHYRRIEVIAANSRSQRILGGTEPRFVPEYALRPVTPEDLTVE